MYIIRHPKASGICVRVCVCVCTCVCVCVCVHYAPPGSPQTCNRCRPARCKENVCRHPQPHGWVGGGAVTPPCTAHQAAESAWRGRREGAESARIGCGEGAVSTCRAHGEGGADPGYVVRPQAWAKQHAELVHLVSTVAATVMGAPYAVRSRPVRSRTARWPHHVHTYCGCLLRLPTAATYGGYSCIACTLDAASTLHVQRKCSASVVRARSACTWKKVSVTAEKRSTGCAREVEPGWSKRRWNRSLPRWNRWLCPAAVPTLAGCSERLWPRARARSHQAGPAQWPVVSLRRGQDGRFPVLARAVSADGDDIRPVAPEALQADQYGLDRGAAGRPAWRRRQRAPEDLAQREESCGGVEERGDGVSGERLPEVGPPLWRDGAGRFEDADRDHV